ncbi:MAG: choice-of-anchor X domain-containing protein, partial [Pirellulales bacterium]
RSGVASDLAAEGFTVSEFAAPPVSYDEFTSVVLLRANDSNGSAAGNVALAAWVQAGGQLITDWNAAQWALTTAGLLDADDLNAGPNFGGINLGPDTAVTFTAAGIASGLADGVSNPYVGGGATEYFRQFSNIGPSVDVLASRPGGVPAILGGQSGAGSVIVIGYDWSDFFASTNADNRQLLINALAPEPPSAHLPWIGDAGAVGDGIQSLQRFGSADNDNSSDFLRQATTPGVQNGGLIVPYPTSTPTAAIGVGYELGSGFEHLIATNLQPAMYRRNSSAFVRIPFEVPLETTTSAVLRIRYDDGFVAYLNGTKVAEANAPTLLTWNSAATAARPDDMAVAFSDFAIADFSALLVPGANVLAIHGLNRSADDPDFLIDAELIARGDVAQTFTGYFLTPTPGEENDAASARNTGPGLADLTTNPVPPGENDSLIIAASVTSHGSAMETVTLHYRVMFDLEVAIPMADDGLGSDAIAGDGIFSAAIPASAASAGELLRWYITADDSLDRQSRWPLFPDPDNSDEYLGTVVADASAASNLPVLQWFVQDTAAADTDAGTRATLFADGELYDNVFVRI